jgi:hypothetical protein
VGLPEMRRWLQIATTGPVVKRALKFAVVVGAILISINHGDAILSGNVDNTRIAKMVLTVFVPFAVSTASSVAALIERDS